MRKVAAVLLSLLFLSDGRQLHGGPAESVGSSAKEERCQKALAAFMLARTSATALVPKTMRASSAVGFRRAPSAQRAARAGAPTMLADQTAAAYGWISSLRPPAALVAGAALKQGYDLEKDMMPAKGDKRWVSVAKKSGRLLFLSAFALEIACVFVSTVTGTMLLGRGVADPIATSALNMLHRESEFEYLLCRVFFFQGLINWLSGVALHQVLPKKDLTKAARRIHWTVASAIATIIIYMIAFYNHHISFYANYGVMLIKLVTLTFSRKYMQGFRILPLVALIPLASTVVNAVLSLLDHDEPGNEESD